MTARLAPALFATILLAAPTSVPAQAQAGERTGLLESLVQCRATTDSAARLACYDSAVAAVDAAERSGDLLVVDRAQVRDAQRQQFGFQIPSLGILSRGTQPEVVDSVASPLRSATERATGKWLFTLEDGSAWLQIDNQTIRVPPRPGAEITVRRAAIGSFLLSTGVGRAVRVERLQ